MVYPTPYYAVGDLYLTINPENPKTRLGYGTWELYGPGRAIVCVDTFDSDFNIVGKTVGEKKHTLSIDEIPSHYHNLNNAKISNQFTSGDTKGVDWILNGANWGDISSQSTGGNQPHNNIQPSITCYIWLRTA